MASRNRNRPGVVKEDADEERSLWNQIRSESKRIDSLVVSFLFTHNFWFSNSRDIVLCRDAHTDLRLPRWQADHNSKWHRMQEIRQLLDSQHGMLHFKLWRGNNRLHWNFLPASVNSIPTL